MTISLMTLSVPVAAVRDAARRPALSRVAAFPAAAGAWSRGRSIDGTSSYATTIAAKAAEAAKHGKAADPPRGTTV